jgi:hypothetical protein
MNSTTIQEFSLQQKTPVAEVEHVDIDPELFTASLEHLIDVRLALLTSMRELRNSAERALEHAASSGVTPETLQFVQEAGESLAIQQKTVNSLKTLIELKEAEQRAKDAEITQQEAMSQGTSRDLRENTIASILVARAELTYNTSLSIGARQAILDHIAFLDSTLGGTPADVPSEVRSIY